nr:prephenate dehydrogenase [Limosilactobacillus albertensis]
MVETVFIKGLGLIGSSLARAIRQDHPQIQIIASDVNEETLQYAKENNIADRVVTDMTGVDQADYIILASPVSQIIKDITALANLKLKSGVIITDVGSTKQTIMQAGKVLTQRNLTFIGGHPMAGSHKSGVQAGRADLIENAYYFLLPASESTDTSKLTWLLAGTNAKWLELTPSQHDKIVAQISHVPHIIAAELVNQTQQAFKDEPVGMRVAAGGFKSVTRIAASDPTMWSAILLNNKELILKQLTSYITGLENIGALIKKEDRSALFDFFKQAKVSRESLNTPARAPFYDLFLNIPDKSGEIARVTGMLAKHHLSIINIQILEVREDINGILQLVFNTEEARDQAARILEKDYEIVTR